MSKLTDEFEKIRFDENKAKERKELLEKMTNDEIDTLIQATALVQGKIALSKFKKNN